MTIDAVKLEQARTSVQWATERVWEVSKTSKGVEIIEICEQSEKKPMRIPHLIMDLVGQTIIRVDVKDIDNITKAWIFELDKHILTIDKTGFDIKLK